MECMLNIKQQAHKKNKEDNFKNGKALRYLIKEYFIKSKL